MPRLRPPARTQEEIGQAPKDEPIDIELEAAPEPEATVEVAEPEPQVVEAPEPEKPPEPPPDMTERLAGLERSETENKRLQQQVADYQRREEEGKRKAAAKEVEHRSSINEAQYAAILNAMEAANEKISSAKRAFAIALEAGDHAAAAEAQDQMSDARIDFKHWDQRKIDIEEEQKVKAEPRVEQPQPSQQDAFEATIAQYPQEAQRRFRAHPEYVTDHAKSKVLVQAHYRALGAGHDQFSPRYFQYLDDEVFEPRKPVAPIEQRIGDQVQEIKQRSTAVPSAPPTRDVPSSATGKPQSTRVTLTAEERDIARQTRSKHQSPEEAELAYARSKMKYAEAKKSGQYQERG